MIDLSLNEAQLLRLLTRFFGRERVIPCMSVLSVCGGTLSPDLECAELGMSREGLESWARKNSCLFTIVDDDANPCMVLEMRTAPEGVIDVTELEHCRYLTPLLAHQRIHYVVMTEDELAEILDPDASLDMFSFLRDKIDTSL